MDHYIDPLPANGSNNAEWAQIIEFLSDIRGWLLGLLTDIFSPGSTD